MNLRDTPRERMDKHLAAMGIEIGHPDDIWVVKGFWAQARADCAERWRVKGFKDGKRIEVTGLDSLTACYRGCTIRPAERSDEVYGDYVVTALPRA